MTDKETAYRNVVEMISLSQQEYLIRAENTYYPMHERYRAWLQLLGLIETWVIIHDR